jgi:hypothetical protein
VNAFGCAAAAAGLTLGAGGSITQALKAFAFAYISVNVWSEVGQFVRAAGVAGDILGKGLIHGVVGGALSLAQGGSFLQGFATSAVGAGTGLLSSNISGDNVFLDSAIVGAAGGLAAQLTGGKFANGFITAAFANLYNKYAALGASCGRGWARFSAVSPRHWRLFLPMPQREGLTSRQLLRRLQLVSPVGPARDRGLDRQSAQSLMLLVAQRMKCPNSLLSGRYIQIRPMIAMQKQKDRLNTGELKALMI